MELMAHLKILLLAACLSSALTFDGQEFGSGISVTTGTTGPELSLKLSFDEMHMIVDFVVEISLLGCPTLNVTSARSMKTFLRERVRASEYRELHKPGFDEFRSLLSTCFVEMSRKRKDETTTVSTTTTTTTAAPTEPPIETSTTSAPPVPVTVVLPRPKKSSWTSMLDWVSDMYNKTTSFFTRVLSKKRTRRDAAARARGNDGFDFTLQAQQMFEEMIRAMMQIVNHSCGPEALKFERYIEKVEAEVNHWIGSYREPDIIRLSDYYFSTSDLLRLARKCAAAAA